MKTELRVYSEEEIGRRLAAELPHWYYENGTIRRKYRTEGWKGTLMVVGAIGHLAEAAWHHPDLTVSYAFVIVKLTTHVAKGVTDRDFALARKIEEVARVGIASHSGGWSVRVRRRTKRTAALGRTGSRWRRTRRPRCAPRSPTPKSCLRPQRRASR